jgi:hypothetical protein
MYLCPLAVLLLFAIGVVILSIVVPRLQERQQDQDEFGYSAALYGVTTGAVGDGGPQQDLVHAPEEATFKVDGLNAGPAVERPADPLVEDNPSLEDISFAPNGPLIDSEPLAHDISFDPLFEDLVPPESQETARASSAPEEQN